MNGKWIGKLLNNSLNTRKKKYCSFWLVVVPFFYSRQAEVLQQTVTQMWVSFHKSVLRFNTSACSSSIVCLHTYNRITAGFFWNNDLLDCCFTMTFVIWAFDTRTNCLKMVNMSLASICLDLLWVQFCKEVDVQTVYCCAGVPSSQRLSRQPSWDHLLGVQRQGQELSSHGTPYPPGVLQGTRQTPIQHSGQSMWVLSHNRLAIKLAVGQ